MLWELGAVCIMSPIKRDQSWRGAAEFPYSLQMMHTLASSVWRGLAEEWEEGQSTSRPPVTGSPSALLAPSSYWEAETRHILSHICSIHLLRDIAHVPGLRASIFSPPQLEYQIMNSQFQQEAIRTKCPFKFELITNNLRSDSGEL